MSLSLQKSDFYVTIATVIFSHVKITCYFLKSSRCLYKKLGMLTRIYKKCFTIHSVTLRACLNLHFSENHSNKIVNFMLDVMCPIIHEGDSVPQELLDTVLVNIIEPQKVSPLIFSFLWFTDRFIHVTLQVKFQSQVEFQHKIATCNSLLSLTITILLQNAILANVTKVSLAKFRRHTSHEPNRMQMKKNLCSPSLSFISIQFGSCEVRRLNRALDTVCPRFTELVLSIGCPARHWVWSWLSYDMLASYQYYFLSIASQLIY